MNETFRNFPDFEFPIHVVKKKIILAVNVRMTYSFVLSTSLRVPWSFAYLHYTSYLDNSAND